MILMYKLLALAVPMLTARWIIYKLDRLIRRQGHHLKMTKERREILVKAHRNDSMVQMRGEELS